MNDVLSLTARTYLHLSGASRLKRSCRYLDRTITDDTLHYAEALQFNATHREASLRRFWEYLFRPGRGETDGAPSGPASRASTVTRWLLRWGANTSGPPDIASPLEIASALGDEESVRLMLQHGAAENGCTSAFHPAATRRNLNILRLLLQHSKDPSDVDIVLRTGAGCGFEDIVDLALVHGADVHAESEGALECACEGGFEDLVKLLIQHGAHVTSAGGQRALHLAVGSGSFGTVETMMKHGARMTRADFQVAAMSGHVEIAELCLNSVHSGANLQAGNNIALRVAAASGEWDVVRFLIEKGATVQAANDTALRIAVAHGNVEIVRLLLEHGADARTARRVLKAGVRHSNPALTSLLADHGADVHLEDEAALVTAAGEGNYEVVQALLGRGAVVTDRAMDVAAAGGHEMILEILRDVQPDRRAGGVDDNWSLSMDLDVEMMG
ncbi:hypothetical protein HK104_006702 [Borealophlyctis nickersoniae]|nr:hypothetical protein HK104_006702 [Borealophlyctis nickersoniae]